MNQTHAVLTYNSMVFKAIVGAFRAVRWLGRTIGLFEGESFAYLQMPKALRGAVSDFLDNKSVVQLLCVNKQTRAEVAAFFTEAVRLRRALFQRSIIMNPRVQVTSFFQTWVARNRFKTFCYVPPLDQVITGDDAEYDALKDPLKAWNCRGENLHTLHALFFTKPIEHITFNSAKNELAVSSRHRIQIVDVANGLAPIVEFEDGHYSHEITALYYERGLLAYGSQTGRLTVHRVDATPVTRDNGELFFEQDRSPIHWIDVNHEKKQIFFQAESSVYIYHLETKKRLHEIANTGWKIGLRPIYDAQNDWLFTTDNAASKIYVWSASDAKLQHTCDLTDKLTAIYFVCYDAESQQLFIHGSTNSGVAVCMWSLKEPHVKRSFTTESCEEKWRVFSDMKYDQKLGLLVTVGRGLQLWDVNTTRCIQNVKTGPGNTVDMMHWDKTKSKFLLLDSGSETSTVQVLDYSKKLD